MASARLVVFIFSATAALATGASNRCPDQWVYFQDSCYAFLDEVAPWSMAETYCRILNPKSKMLEVETKAENDFIASEIRARAGITAVWQGINDLLREGRWVFNSNGQEPTFFNWHSGTPDNSHRVENGQDCMQIYSDGTWDDLWCEVHISGYNPSPVCEIDAPDEELIG